MKATSFQSTSRRTSTSTTSSNLLKLLKKKLSRFRTRYLIYLSFQLVPGNVNTYTPRKSTLEAPFVASKVRFFPYAAHPRTACMRVELYGCRWKRMYKKKKVSLTRDVPGPLCLAN